MECVSSPRPRRRRRAGISRQASCAISSSAASRRSMMEISVAANRRRGPDAAAHRSPVRCRPASRRAPRRMPADRRVLSQTLLGGWLGYDRWRRFSQRNSNMIEFKGSHFERDVILWGVRWYVAYPISYRQLEEMMKSAASKSTISTAQSLGGQVRAVAGSAIAPASVRLAPAGEWTRHM